MVDRCHAPFRRAAFGTFDRAPGNSGGRRQRVRNSRGDALSRRDGSPEDADKGRTPNAGFRSSAKNREAGISGGAHDICRFLLVLFYAGNSHKGIRIFLELRRRRFISCSRHAHSLASSASRTETAPRRDKGFVRSNRRPARPPQRSDRRRVHVDFPEKTLYPPARRGTHRGFGNRPQTDRHRQCDGGILPPGYRHKPLG